jgi:hypothetical protein
MVARDKMTGPSAALTAKPASSHSSQGNLRSQVARTRLSRRQDGPVSAYAWTFNNLGCMAHTARVCVAVRDPHTQIVMGLGLEQLVMLTRARFRYRDAENYRSMPN